VRLGLDFDAGTKEPGESLDEVKTHELPDENIITTGSERFRCPEVSFQQLHWQRSQWHPQYNIPINYAVQSKRLACECYFFWLFTGIGESMSQELTVLPPPTMKF